MQSPCGSGHQGIRGMPTCTRRITDANSVATSAEGPPASPARRASSGEAARGTCVHIMRQSIRGLQQQLVGNVNGNGKHLSRDAPQHLCMLAFLAVLGTFQRHSSVLNLRMRDGASCSSACSDACGTCRHRQACAPQWRRCPGRLHAARPLKHEQRAAPVQASPSDHPGHAGAAAKR